MYLLRSSVHTAGDDDVLPGRWPQLSPLGCCCQAPEITDNTEKCSQCIVQSTYETLLPKTIFTLGASLMPLDLIKLQWFE